MTGARGLPGGIHEATLAFGIAGGALVGGLAGQYMGIREPYKVGMLVVALLVFTQVHIFLRWVKPARAEAE